MCLMLKNETGYALMIVMDRCFEWFVDVSGCHMLHHNKQTLCTHCKSEMYTQCSCETNADIVLVRNIECGHVAMLPTLVLFRTDSMLATYQMDTAICWDASHYTTCWHNMNDLQKWHMDDGMCRQPLSIVQGPDLRCVAFAVFVIDSFLQKSSKRTPWATPAFNLCPRKHHSVIRDKLPLSCRTEV